MYESNPHTQLPATCLSAAEHDDRVSDICLHYFGCLRRSQRRRFFDALSPDQQLRLAKERTKTEQRRADVEVEGERAAQEQALREEVRRRRIGANNGGRAGGATGGRRLGRRNGRNDSDATDDTVVSIDKPGAESDEGEQYSLSVARLRDFKDDIAQYRTAKCWPAATEPWQQRRRQPEAIDEDEDVDAHVKAPVVFFRDSEPWDVPGLEGTFPNQKISVQDLLAEDSNPSRNPLMAACPEDAVRYIHLPANNMAWIEEAVARYYHERRPSQRDQDTFLNPKLRQNTNRGPRTRTETLLRHELWRGQQGFDENSEVHARHMRPMCSAVAVSERGSEPGTLADGRRDRPGSLPRNLVLFMPYLHWETDRGRFLSAEAIKEVNKVNDARRRKFTGIADVVKAQKDQTQTGGNGQGSNHHGGLGLDALAGPYFAGSAHPNAAANTDYFNGQHASAAAAAAAPMTPAAREERRRLLGRVLLSAAALLEAMEFRTEEKLIRTYLHSRPPLHPRRTLDQSYYGGLKNTGTRDRDQVVYRATTPQGHDCDDYWDKDAPGGGKCTQCHEDIRKVSRLIMVDQLWLWILDEKTVITAFPRRWGKNRPDPSAVHKSLRLRLKEARRGDISSAYDLALIIIDECSRVFFDRTRTDERKPNLLDMFADSIRDVTYKQTAAFDQFLIYTHLASREYRRPTSGPGASYHDDQSSTQNTLLNINPEGNLLKEVKDIMDEIHIIARIQADQQAVLEAMVRHVRLALIPRTRGSGFGTSKSPGLGVNAGMSSWDAVLGAVQQQTSDRAASESEKQEREQTQRDRARWTLSRADQVLADVTARMAELETLLVNARNTSAALKDLLTLKQQQAGVIEAREAVKQAAETLKQGRSIMLFTVITIIFLPLSFFSTLFGMNAQEINDGSQLTLAQEFSFMFPISAVIIALAFALAFGRNALASSVWSLAHSSISLPINTALTWVLVKSGAYVAGRRMAAKAARLRDREAQVTGLMKAEVIRKKKNLGRNHAVRRVATTTNLLVLDEQQQNEGGTNGRRTPRPLGSPFVHTPTMATPMMATPLSASGRNPFFVAGGAVARDGTVMYDVEMAQRNGSRVNLVDR